MERVGKVSRLTTGLLLIIFGIQGFTGFMGERVLPVEAVRALECLEMLRFVIPLLSTLAVLTGALLLANLFVPVAISIAIVLIISTLLFHLSFHPKGILFAAIGFIASILVVIDHAKAFAAIRSK